MYRYNKTVKVWLFRDTGSIHYPWLMFISLGCAFGNKPGLRAMETAYTPHNHTLTVLYNLFCIFGNICTETVPAFRDQTASTHKLQLIDCGTSL